MTKLSVNINKFATLRNARGGNLPNITQSAVDCEKFGAEGITVHPRPDERHIRYSDVYELKSVVTTEFNIEGNPIDSLIKLVLDAHPVQVTLVPDRHDAITSDSGWDTKKNLRFLKEICSLFSAEGIRTSVFVDPDTEMVKYAAETGCNRIELYTEGYASLYPTDKDSAVECYIKAAECALQHGLGINAGHDLNLDNLNFFHKSVPGLLEVSIGHAIICDSIYLGLENTIQAYLRQLKNY